MKIAAYSPEIYDMIYMNSKKYKCHYTNSPYYPLWQASLKHISGDVMEFGCGTGQFAQMLYHNLNLPYTGVDFSREAIRQARVRNPLLEFVCTDVFSVDTSQYDIILAFEVLEHIEDDLGILECLQPNQKIVFSVPDYMARNHYRCFKSKDEIINRYQSLSIHSIEKFELAKNKLSDVNTLFLAHGNKK